MHMDAPKTLFVTRPTLPPLSEYLPLIEKIWASRVLTNFGPYHAQFIDGLRHYLGVEHVSLVTNATVGLMLAVRALKLTGEVITTPFSFVATGHSMLWAGVKPVFVDINPNTLNIDATKIEAAITPRTSGIMAVHCYGRPCNVEAIEDIARRHGLRVIYDAAHAFGIQHKGQSVLKQGDLSVLSFHATKVFNTLEGGAIISHSAETKLEIDRLINYGIVDEQTIEGTGFNAKMSELTAALGIVQLRHIDGYIQQRRRVDTNYRLLLGDIPGLHFVHPAGAAPRNYYSFPILIGGEHARTRDELYFRLREHSVFARRYFYPLICDLPMYAMGSGSTADVAHARRIADQVLCLPMYPDLTESEQSRIAEVIRS
jgi:dTDP-4-amino-4,6-dideoxygalactose transaminase